MIIFHKGSNEFEIPITDFIPRIVEERFITEGLRDVYSSILDGMNDSMRLEDEGSWVRVRNFLMRKFNDDELSKYPENLVDYFLFVIPWSSRRSNGGEEEKFFRGWRGCDEFLNKTPRFGRILYLDEVKNKLEIYKMVESGGFSAVAIPQRIVDASLMETLDVLGIPTFIFLNSFKEFDIETNGNRVVLVPLDENMRLGDYLKLLNRGFKLLLPTYNPSLSKELITFKQHSKNLIFSSMFPYAKEEDVLEVLLAVMNENCRRKVLFQNIMDVLGPFPFIHTTFRNSMVWEFKNSWAENYVLNKVIYALSLTNSIYELRPLCLKEHFEAFSLVMGKDVMAPILIERDMRSGRISILSNEDLKEMHSKSHEMFEYVRGVKRGVLESSRSILKMFQIIARKTLKERSFELLSFMPKVKISTHDSKNFYLKYPPKDVGKNVFLKFFHQSSNKEWEVMVNLLNGNTDLIELPKKFAMVIDVKDGDVIIPIGLSRRETPTKVVMVKVDGEVDGGLEDYVKRNLSGIVLEDRKSFPLNYKGKKINLFFITPSHSKEFFIGDDTRVIFQRGGMDLHLFIEVSKGMNKVDVDITELSKAFNISGEKIDRMRATLILLNILFEKVSNLKVFDRIHIYLLSHKRKKINRIGGPRRE
ncbi:MAG: hypothetical protein J7L50_01580, partial [Candidatus Odinarchaeota archaeon]|nr:hypothetical protein [Candidatus Odinarchaeota archaeon]